MTHYLVLKWNGNAWEEMSGTTASSPARAIRAAVKDEGKYVAVPARSWKTLTVSVEQTTKITVG